jgi:hypothetical protein
MTLGSHQHTIGKSQVRITPRSILNPLDVFDTDPCAADPRPWDCARHNITVEQNSLTMDWRAFGRVWLNPPFDRRIVGEFIRRMCEHNHGIALIHVRTETEWFRPIWECASALRFLAGRYVFHNPDGSKAKIEKPESKHYGKVANSGAPIALVAFGWSDADVLCLCGIEGHFVPLRIPRSVIVEAIEPSWREAVTDWLRTQRGPISVADLYAAFIDHPKAKRNRNWKPKLRQTLLRGAGRSVGRDQWVPA